ncbi:MAG TPA: hypothetical protein VKE70_29430 [Candidatus Solibacter sp.]|nr:hypothetical protein [Candidatus Solibacter sp.]
MVFFGLSMALCTSTLLAQPYSTWSDYGGSADSMQCSSLKQITKFNVAQLQQVWTYLVPGTQGRFGFNPLVTPTPPRQPPAVEPEGPVITINRFGKGIAIYCVPPIFTAYQQDGTPGRRCLIAWMLDQVYPAALRSIVLENAPSHVELTYQSRGHDRFVHLVNFGEGRGMSGPQRARGISGPFTIFAFAHAAPRARAKYRSCPRDTT